MKEKIIICNAMEDRKQKLIKEYDLKINEVKNEDNLARIYYLLTKTFHNTMEQREIEICVKFLKENLVNDFFKESEVKNGVNYIIFSNKDFDVMFSKYLSKEIVIEFKDKTLPWTFFGGVNENIAKLADLIENYLNNKSLRNFKLLVNHNCVNYKNNLLANVMKYINTYKKCNKDLLDEIRNEQEQSRIQFEKVKERNEEYNRKQQYANSFVDSLEQDLKLFKDEGWYIRLKGIKTF